MPRTFLVIDDHPLVQEAVASALQSLGTDVRIVAASNAQEAVAAVRDQDALDLALLDLALPDMNGMELIRKLRAQQPTLPILVLSALEAPENVRQAIAAGAMGFVPKSAARRVLLDALTRVLAGDMSIPQRLQPASVVTPAENGAIADRAAEIPEAPPATASAGTGSGATTAEPELATLTTRQVQVLSRVCEGKTNKQIATELALSEKTVKAHITAIFKVLGVVNRTQAVLAARRLATLIV